MTVLFVGDIHLKSARVLPAVDRAVAMTGTDGVVFWATSATTGTSQPARRSPRSACSPIGWPPAGLPDST